jgi:hypothetical protein
VTYQFDATRFDRYCRAGHAGDADCAAGPATADHTHEVAFRTTPDSRRTGFIAQEVERAAKESGFVFSGVNRPATDKGYYTLSYELFVVPLVKAVQEQQAIIGQQDHRLEAMQQEIDELKKLICH